MAQLQSNMVLEEEEVQSDTKQVCGIDSGGFHLSYEAAQFSQPL